MPKPYVSIIVPLFNEQEVFPELLHALRQVGDGLHQEYEIIFVDDGSTDNTPNLLREVSLRDSRIKVLRFSRNFGHQAAFNSGIDMATGDLIITMDGDLQHPPSLIPTFIQYAQEGHDIIIGERIKNKQNSFIREHIGKLFYKILSSITDLEFRNASDFGLYKRSVITVLKKMPERERFLRGIIQWVGFKKKYVPYTVGVRRQGQSKYTFKKLFNLILSGVTSFSATPLRLTFWLGLFVFVVSIIFSGYVVIDHYVNPNPLIIGWATLVILVLVIGSIQLMLLGIVGEYLYKMFNEIKGRPLYIVAETYNIDREDIEHTPYGLHVT